MHKSEKILPDVTIDYKALYYEERKLRQEFQKRAELAELKLRKLSQSVNKKCLRCMKIDEKQSKNQKIKELRQFKAGLSQKYIKTIPKKSCEKRYHPVIENFAVFGAPQSILADPFEWDDQIESQVLYISDFPTDTVMHSAKLVFPAGIVPKFYSGPEAKEKSIEIMSSNCAFSKSFIMSFESEENAEQCELLKIMNPQNRLYAICLNVEDFTMVPYLPEKYFESEKTVSSSGGGFITPQPPPKISHKALSCDDTEATNSAQKQCHIATSQRTYCLFSRYPFFHFYEELLKSVISSVKTERLVIYRESGCVTAEADSHFFLERIKVTFKELSDQIENWQLKINKELELKLITCQKLSLRLFPDQCKYNFIQQWGLPILKQFTPQTFLDIFLLIMLEQKVVFVSDNHTLLTYTIHLFTRLLPQPLRYPYPTVYMLPPRQEFLNSPFPVVYGYSSSKEEMDESNMTARYKNTYVFLKNSSCTQVVGSSYKYISKKRPPKLHNFLTQIFKMVKSYQHKRASMLTFTDNEQVQYSKDKAGVCFEVIRNFNKFMQQSIISNLPKQSQLKEIGDKILKNGLGKGKQLNQQIFKVITEKYHNKVKEPLFNQLLETQIVNVHLFP